MSDLDTNSTFADPRATRGEQRQPLLLSSHSDISRGLCIQQTNRVWKRAHCEPLRMISATYDVYSNNTGTLSGDSNPVVVTGSRTSTHRNNGPHTWGAQQPGGPCVYEGPSALSAACRQRAQQRGKARARQRSTQAAHALSGDSTAVSTHTA